MIQKKPKIYFYIPGSDWPKVIPDRAEDLRPEDVLGSWILQTYLRLQESGFSCQLVSEMPEEGVLVAYRYSLPYEAKPPADLLWVCVKGDQNPHPYAPIHIVQNACEVDSPALQIQSVDEDRYLLPSKRFYLPHWPQAGVIPRSAERGDRFENVAYFGITYNLAPELCQLEWQQQLKEMGLNWRREKERDRWNDYSEVDAILAVRSFNNSTDYPWKPASKLFNAWNAGVPAILGRESAFRGERKSELDYLEVNSYPETVNALKRLRDDTQFRQAMIDNCRQRAQDITPENITKRWQDFLLNTCLPAYEEWRSLSDWQRQKFFMGRYLALKWNSWERRILSWKRQKNYR